MVSCGGNHRAENLKNEGNNLFQKGQFRAAYRKYTEAIKEDEKNAIYYANRAACSLSLKEYMEASTDARMATKLDPNYAKAWARLGTAKYALGLWANSAEAWRSAATCLPPLDQFTDTDKRLSLQISEGLQKASAALRREKEPEIRAFAFEHAGMMPWLRAEAKLEKLQEEKKVSSAFVIAYAYRDFKKGVDTMKMLAQRPTPNGQLAWVGKPDALVDISNGLMRDPRAFHIDCSDWFEKYNIQVMFECQCFGGWKDEGAKFIINELPKKVKRDGWDKTRRNHTSVITLLPLAWIICGLFATSTEKPMLAVEYHSRVLEVLNWGSRVWKDIPTSDRGCVFERTFIRGIRRLHVMAIHALLARKIKDSPYTKDQLAELCHELVAETDAHPPNPFDDQVDPGFFLSFWVYPKAEALAILGWCQNQIGLEAEDAATAMTAFGEAEEFYKQACGVLPRDDEMAPSFLVAGLEACWFGNKPLEDVLHFLIWMQELIPKMREIWEHSPVSVPRDERLEAATRFALACAKGKFDGQLTETTVVKPISVKRLDRWAVPNVIYI